MSALIKFGDGGAARSLTLATRPVLEAPSLDPREQEIARLASEVLRLSEALAESGARGREAVSDAREQGRLAGFAAAEDREAERLAALRVALDKAGEAFGVRLAAIEGLAPQLVRAALGKLFGSVETWTPMVEASLTCRLARIRRAGVVGLHVSPADFADVETLAEALDGGNLAITLDADLPSGAARLTCKLGRIDLDVREQWAALAALLDEMASEAAE